MILHNKHILSFLRFGTSVLVEVISCVVSSVAIFVISGSCVFDGVSCNFFEPCIVVVVGSGGAVGVVGPGAVDMEEIFIP